MQFIDFIFNVIREVSPIDPNEASKLKAEIQTKWDDVVTDPNHPNFKQDEGLKAKFIGFTRKPEFRLFLAISFLYWVKTYRDWFEGKYDDWKKKEDND